MKQNKQLFEAWQNGVQLGHAWWAFAGARNKNRFRELQREGEHVGLQRSLEIELAARISAGELKAIGIEDGSDAGPVFIPQYYFSKTVIIDWDKDIVTALSRKFYEVRVHDERKPSAEAMTEPELIDPRTIEGLREPVPETLPSEPGVSNEPLIQGDRQSDETPPSEPVPERHDEAPSRQKVGRPSKGPEIEQAIELLLGRGVDLAGMTRPKAYAAVKDCAANELKSNIKIGFNNSVIHRYLFRRFGPRR